MRRPRNDTTRHPPCPCPACGKSVDAATFVGKEHARAKPGDISICLYCGTRLVFTRTMRVRLMLEREWLQLEPDHRKYIESLQIRREQIAAKQADFPHGFPTKHNA